MIISILILYNLGTSFIKYCLKRKHSNSVWNVLIFDVPNIEGDTYYDDNNDLKFSPPVYYLRYEAVKSILETIYEYSSIDGLLKVVDFGCAEIRLFNIVKHMKGVQEYLAVDIDDDLLNRNSDRVLPLTFDYLKKRSDPLSVQVLCGSVSVPDKRLEGANVVIAIELIEHLYPDVLEELPYNIFGIIQPEVAVFTTPNSEYNIFFPNFTGFRHYDHKFEWTREQFQTWANNLTLRYPNYRVFFGGVGESPDYKRNVGYCSQIAIFFRNRIKYDTSSHFYDAYEEIRKVDYPFQTEDEKLKDIVQYETGIFISRYSTLDKYQTEDNIEIPVKDILDFILEGYSYSENDVRKTLSSCGWKIQASKDGTYVLKLSIFGESNFDDTSNLSTSSESIEDDPATTTTTYVYHQTIVDEQDWDGSADDSTIVNVMDHDLNAPEPTANNAATMDEPSPSQSSVLEQQEAGVSASSSNHNASTEVVNCTADSTEEPGCSSCSSPAYRNVSPSKQTMKLVSDGSDDVVRNENNSDKYFKKSPLQKCMSLESVNKDSSKSSMCRFSLNIDKYKLSNCDIDCSADSSVLNNATVPFSVSDSFVPRLEDSCSQSKAADSGYPNSNGQDMDMDLTPEQVDEIITESESSFDVDGDVDDESVADDDRPMELIGDIVRLGENVENGDVANNNRDDEGNNMEAVVAAIGDGIREFEQVIEEEELILGNLAVADQLQLQDQEENLDSSGDGRIVAAASVIEEVEADADELGEGFIMPLHNVVFPNWLVNILVEDTEQEVIADGHAPNMGGGDVLGEEFNLDDDDSDNELVSDNEVVSDNEAVSDLELLNEPPRELIVPGDLMGGGEPPPTEY